MVRKQFGELNKGDKIVMFGKTLVVENVEVSEKGVKQGRTKARIEAIDEQGEKKTVIRLAKQPVEVK